MFRNKKRNKLKLSIINATVTILNQILTSNASESSKYNRTLITDSISSLLSLFVDYKRLHGLRYASIHDIYKTDIATFVVKSEFCSNQQGHNYKDNIAQILSILDLLASHTDLIEHSDIDQIVFLPFSFLLNRNGMDFFCHISETNPFYKFEIIKDVSIAAYNPKIAYEQRSLHDNEIIQCLFASILDITNEHHITEISNEVLPYIKSIRDIELLEFPSYRLPIEDQISILQKNNKKIGTVDICHNDEQVSRYLNGIETLNEELHLNDDLFGDDDEDILFDDNLFDESLDDTVTDTSEEDELLFDLDLGDDEDNLEEAMIKSNLTEIEVELELDNVNELENTISLNEETAFIFPEHISEVSGDFKFFTPGASYLSLIEPSSHLFNIDKSLSVNEKIDLIHKSLDQIKRLNNGLLLFSTKNKDNKDKELSFINQMINRIIDSILMTNGNYSNISHESNIVNTRLYLLENICREQAKYISKKEIEVGELNRSIRIGVHTNALNYTLAKRLLETISNELSLTKYDQTINVDGIMVKLRDISITKNSDLSKLNLTEKEAEQILFKHKCINASEIIDIDNEALSISKDLRMNLINSDSYHSWNIPTITENQKIESVSLSKTARYNDYRFRTPYSINKKETYGI